MAVIVEIAGMAAPTGSVAGRVGSMAGKAFVYFHESARRRFKGGDGDGGRTKAARGSGRDRNTVPESPGSDDLRASLSASLGDCHRLIPRASPTSVQPEVRPIVRGKSSLLGFFPCHCQEVRFPPRPLFVGGFAPRVIPLALRAETRV